MRRREMLLSTGAAVVGLSTFPIGWTAAANNRKQKLLYFTRNCLHEHEPVRPRNGELSLSEELLIEWGKTAGFDVDCSKDGRVFDGDLDQYNTIVFYTSGTCNDLMTKPSTQKTPPISPQGKKRLFDAFAAGTGFVGIHSAISFSPQLIGSGYSGHGTPQDGTMLVTSPGFPGAGGLGKSFSLFEEWFTFQRLGEDLHVILAQDTAAMKQVDPRPKKQELYDRPPFPATWARQHEKGRVFYTSLGHFSHVWTSKIFQQILLGALAWTMGNAEADVTPNITKVTPRGNEKTRIGP
jgi:type 1 glutamine amidotransferase